jgi:cbb3-type cytochrome oxidase maturation protein
MSFYYLPWIMLVVISLWVSLAAFFWAFRHGQLADQERARYLPLRGEPIFAAPGKGTGAIRQICVIFGILFIGISGLVATVVITIMKMPGAGP